MNLPCRGEGRGCRKMGSRGGGGGGRGTGERRGKAGERKKKKKYDDKESNKYLKEVSVTSADICSSLNDLILKFMSISNKLRYLLALKYLVVQNKTVLFTELYRIRIRIRMLYFTKQ